MARLAKRYQVREGVCFVIISTQAKRFLVVNLQRSSAILFRLAAGLARLTIAPVCLFALLFPIRSIVFNVATLPAWMVFPNNIIRLPFAHTLTTAKVMHSDLSITARDGLSAPVARQFLMPPTESNQAAFFTTSQPAAFVEAFRAIRFGSKRVAADNAVMGILACVVFILTALIAKPQSGCVSGDDDRETLKRMITVRAMYNHGYSSLSIIQHWWLVSKSKIEQLSRQCRMIEIAENYCAVILERMSGMGLEPRLEGNDG